MHVQRKKQPSHQAYRRSHTSRRTLSHNHTPRPISIHLSTPSPHKQSPPSSASSPLRQAVLSPSRRISSKPHLPTHIFSISSRHRDSLPYSRTGRRFQQTTTLPLTTISDSHANSLPETIVPASQLLNIESQITAVWQENTPSIVTFSSLPPNNSMRHYTPRLAQTPGIFGLTGITSPRDLDNLWLDRVTQLEATAHLLFISPTTPHVSIQLIDDISKLLCDLADLAESLRVFHSSPEMVRKAASIHQNTHALIGQWSSSPIVQFTLYNLIRTESLWNSLSTEGRRLVLDLLGRMNVTPPIMHVQAVHELNSLVYQAEEAFTSSAPHPQWISVPAKLQGEVTLADFQFISQNHRSQVNFTSHQDKSSGHKTIAQLFSDPGTIDRFLQICSSRSLRQFLYQNRNIALQKQLPLLENLVSARHLLSLHNNKASFAHSVAVSQMSKTPQVPIDSITQLMDNLSRARLNEFLTIRQVLHAITSPSNLSLSRQPVTVAQIEQGSVSLSGLLHDDYENSDDGDNQQSANSNKRSFTKSFLSRINPKNTRHQNKASSTRIATHESIISPERAAQLATIKHPPQTSEPPPAAAAATTPSDHDLLLPYDIPFVEQNVNAKITSSLTQIDEYLRLDHVLQGTGLLANMLGVQLEVHAIRPGESWLPSDSTVWPTVTNEPLSLDSIFKTYLSPSQAKQTSQSVKHYHSQQQQQQSQVQQDDDGLPPDLVRYTENSPVNNSSFHQAVHRLKQPGTWCSFQDLPQNIDLINTPVFKVHFVDKSTDLLLGVLYMDLYSRHTKNSTGAAQWTISCGRMRHNAPEDPPSKPFLDTMNVLAPRFGSAAPLEQEHADSSSSSSSSSSTTTTQSDPKNSHAIRLAAEQFELPVAILSTYIQPSRRNPVAHTAGTSPTTAFTLRSPSEAVRRPPAYSPQSQLSPLPLLTLDNVQVLFHELGHAMHNICSRTQFQHYSGSRCEMDFVELPSTLFETLAVEPQFLRLYARHYASGVPISNDMLHYVNLSKNLFPVWESTQSALFSLVDQRIHGIPCLLQQGDEPLAALSQYTSNYEQFNAMQATPQLERLYNHFLKQSKSNQREQKHKQQLPVSKHASYGLGDMSDAPNDEEIEDLYDAFAYNTQLKDNTGENPLFEQLISQFKNINGDPRQSTLILHALTHRYSGLDLHEYGTGVDFEALRRRADAIEKHQSSPDSEPSSSSSSTAAPSSSSSSSPLAFYLPTTVYPHAGQPHLVYYGGFYYSYLYSRAFTALVKRLLFDGLFDQQQLTLEQAQQHVLQNHFKSKTTDLKSSTIPDSNQEQQQQQQQQQQQRPTLAETSNFDLVMPCTSVGLEYRRKVLQPGGSRMGFDILADLLGLPQYENEQHAWPSEMFTSETALWETDNAANSKTHAASSSGISVISDELLDEETVQLRHEEIANHQQQGQKYVPTHDQHAIMSTLSIFQEYTGWQLTPATASPDPSSQPCDDLQTVAISNPTHHAPRNGLTQRQHDALKIAFSVLEEDISRQSSRNMETIRQAFQF